MKPFSLHDFKKQSGLSLIELMVALLISSILLLGVLELFGSSSQSSRSANAVARLQENGRLAMDLITREARRSGFNGCDGGLEGSEIEFDNNAIGGGKVLLPSESLKGSDNNGLTFRYLGASDGVKQNDCEHEKLDQPDTRYYVRFENCDNDPESLCIKSKDTGGARQVLLNHAKIIRIEYIQPCPPPDEERSCNYNNVSAIPDKIDGTSETSFAKVQKLRVTLELCTDTLGESNTNYCQNNNTAIRRTFSSLIELRNRS